MTFGVAGVKEATKALSQKAFGAAIIDLGLPDGSGYEICDFIADHELQVPIIIFTGRDLSDEELMKIRQFTDSVIQKNEHADERLLEEVELFLSGIRTREEGVPKAIRQGVELEGKTVLVVDDDPKNIFVLSSALQDYGLETLHAKNGREALDVLKDNQAVDLVLMDIMMPVMNGYEAMRAIRADEKLRGLPVIAVTAKAMQEDRRRCIEAGADDYLSKPIDPDLLSRMLQAWLNK